MRVVVSSSVLATVLAAAASTPITAGDKFSIATFNCEFLVRHKVHIKFGHPFELKGDLKKEWDKPGFRDKKFSQAAKATAGVIKKINADVLALVEVGDDDDVKELHMEVKKLGLDNPHLAVCDSKDTATGQHVAVFSKHPLNSILKVIPGRESYDEEPDDPETERTTGVSRGMQVAFNVDGRLIHLYVVHLASKRKGQPVPYTY